MTASASERRSQQTAILTAVWLFLALSIPNCILVATENYSVWTNTALLLLPLGCYMMGSVASRRAGVMVWVMLPLLFLAAFQCVLLSLFGGSVIASDMFTNLLTTNSGEAGELLRDMAPAVVAVGLLYGPLPLLAAVGMIRKAVLPACFRREIAVAGAVFALSGGAALIAASFTAGDPHLIRNGIYPASACYNVKLSLSEYRKTRRFAAGTAGFRFDARRTATADKREIYLYVIGEASRACSWELYGYSRSTTPLLAAMDDLILFGDVLTQSNTTHKSVPMILSPVAADRHDDLYRCKGLPALFNEAGFETWFISCQSPQGMMIDNLASDARHLIYLPEPRHDGQLLEAMREAVEAHPDENLLFVLHCYGSHFNYRRRYPRAFARFLPDDEAPATAEYRRQLCNAYDNSICYTDWFLAQTIDYLRSLDACSALLYCADHGEGLFDDRRQRFLHASPETTYYQLHVAALAWFSPEYRKAFPEKVAAARRNANAPATTHALFHTCADIASVACERVDTAASLVRAGYDRRAPRCYLNDRNEALPFRQTGLQPCDLAAFRRFGIEP